MATCLKYNAAEILKSNQDFKENVLNVTREFLDSRNEFLSQIPDISLNNQQINNPQKHFQINTEELFKQYKTNQQPALIIWGPKSCGKTAFINHFLQIGEILPSSTDQITTRIIKLKYSTAKNSYARIFSSLGDYLVKKDPLKTIQLGEYFSNNESPDWETVENILKEHLVRTSDENESEFLEWAKHFIEIGLPSPILELGIEMYDTPGFLSNNRDEKLNENLYELIKSIQPTLLFLYVNSAISETDKNCFLSLKQALGTLENIPIFFLNTKADIISILQNEGVKPNLNRPISLEKFEEVLHNTREKRYQYLLKHEIIAKEIIGGLPNTIDGCDCFDICTIPTNLTPFNDNANSMNERTFERIIQFTVRSDSKPYQALADKILLLIDEYFDIVLSTTYRTEKQWKELHAEALEWAERFFQQIKLAFPSIVNTIHENILKLFDKQKEEIVAGAGTFIRTGNQSGIKYPPSVKTVHEFVRISVYEEIMKVAASEAMNESLSKIDKITNDSLLNSKKKNELLSMARRHIQFWEISGEDLNRKTFFTAILQHVIRTPTRIGRFFISIRTRPFLEWYNQHANQYTDLEALDSYAHLLNESKRRDFARDLLSRMRQNISEQKPLFQKNISEWIERKRVGFISRVNQGCQYAINLLEQITKANKLTKKYSEKFASFECKLLAAKDLVKFNGIKPIIFEKDFLGFGGFFNVYKAQWGDQKNLAVKVLKPDRFDDFPYISYMEAHYHRAITNVYQTNVVPLLYLYHDKNQLYIFMPEYKQSLQKYLQKNIKDINFDTVLNFALIIANVVNNIHQNDLIHRDIKASNILLDKDDRCYLSDFGTATQGILRESVAGATPLPQEIVATALLKQYNLVSVYDGKAADIFAYGILLYELLPKKEYHRPYTEAYETNELFQNNIIYPVPAEMHDYKQLIIDCLQGDVLVRPIISKIIERIKILIRISERKRCAICLENIRTVRTLPCGHKVLCQECRNILRTKNQNLCIVCKRLMQTDTYDDLNQTFYVK